MGIIDRIKDLFRDPLVEELVAAYGLEKRDNRGDPANYYPTVWWEGSFGVDRLRIELFKPAGLVVSLGEIDEDDDPVIHLIRVNPDDPLPEEGAPERLDAIVGPRGADAARKFFLAEPIGEERLKKFLAGPAGLTAVARLHPEVRFVEIYQRGVEITIHNRKVLAREDLDLIITTAGSIGQGLG